MPEAQLVLNPRWRAPGWSQLGWAPGYTYPKFFDNGMIVFVPIEPLAARKSLRCTVKTACGDMARIVNENFNVDTWVHLHDVAVKEITDARVENRSDVSEGG